MAHILKISIACSDQPEVSNAFTRIPGRIGCDSARHQWLSPTWRSRTGVHVRLGTEAHGARDKHIEENYSGNSYATSLAQVPDLANA
ncbi:MAG: hypothetical protein LAO78_28235 [Acidobacteriia bacterium]|nr:hypothetical protein [Terriglobia bacterium]